MVTAFGASSSVFQSERARVWSHHFTWGANVILFGYLMWAVLADKRRRCMTWLGTWGPAILVCFGCVMAMTDPTRHVLLDHGGVIFDESTLAMYNDEGGHSIAGRVSQVCSIIGISFMFCGMLLFVDIPTKLFGLHV